jgi:hypothetical protein
MDESVFVDFRPELRNGFLGFLVSAVICVGFRISQVLRVFFKGFGCFGGLRNRSTIEQKRKRKSGFNYIDICYGFALFFSASDTLNNPMLQHYLHTHCFFRRDTSCTDTK